MSDFNNTSGNTSGSHKATKNRKNKMILLGALLSVLALLCAGVFAYLNLNNNKDKDNTPNNMPNPTSPTQSPADDPSGSETTSNDEASPALAGTAKTKKVDCSKQSNTAFTPVSVQSEKTIGAHHIVVLPRDSNGIPGAPPLSDSGKTQVGLDEDGAYPGEQSGTIGLDAHTYPDGSALGNQMLDKLKVGDDLQLVGSKNEVSCFQISDKKEFNVSKITQAQLDSVYNPDSSPVQLVIIVCSGDRTGPGNWSHRTVWFAKPVTTNAA